MAEQIKYVSLSNLDYYDGKIKEFIDTKDNALKSNLEGQVTVVANALDSEITRAKAAEQDASAAAQAAQTDVDNLETLVGVLPEGATATTVIGYVQEKTANIASEGTVSAIDARLIQAEADIDAVEGRATNLETAVADRYTKAQIDGKVSTLESADSTLQGNINTLSQTVASNKSAIEGTVSTLEQKVDANESDIEGKMTALTARVAANETAVGTTLPNAIAAEQERAEGVESGLNERLEEVESFFKLAEGEQLDTALDTLKEIQNYVTSEGAAADQMVLDIAANAKAIEDMNAAYKAADSTLQGNINSLSAVVDTKASADDLNTLSGKVSTLETNAATHATKDELKGVSDALSAYETAHASDYTNTQIDNKITAATNAEVERADAAYAAKSLETTVSQHTGNTTMHTTADEKALWNAAIQSSDIVTGASNGTIKVKGVDVAVKGLGSAAYTASTAYDAAGSAAAVKDELNAKIDAFVECSESDINQLFQA